MGIDAALALLAAAPSPTNAGEILTTRSFQSEDSFFEDSWGAPLTEAGPPNATATASCARIPDHKANLVRCMEAVQHPQQPEELDYLETSLQGTSKLVSMSAADATWKAGEQASLPYSSQEAPLIAQSASFGAE